jgi:hypothetical protein
MCKFILKNGNKCSRKSKYEDFCEKHADIMFETNGLETYNFYFLHRTLPENLNSIFKDKALKSTKLTKMESEYLENLKSDDLNPLVIDMLKSSVFLELVTFDYFKNIREDEPYAYAFLTFRAETILKNLMNFKHFCLGWNYGERRPWCFDYNESKSLKWNLNLWNYSHKKNKNKVDWNLKTITGEKYPKPNEIVFNKRFRFSYRDVEVITFDVLENFNFKFWNDRKFKSVKKYDLSLQKMIDFWNHHTKDLLTN